MMILSCMNVYKYILGDHHANDYDHHIIALSRSLSTVGDNSRGFLSRAFRAVCAPGKDTLFRDMM